MDSGWDQLSMSSKRALRFAWAAAQERTGLLPPSAVVDPWDLLVGILLSHPGTSEAEQTFRHYGLVAGQALPEGYPRLTAAALNRHLAAVPADDSPPLNDDANLIIQSAISTRVSGGAAVVTELRSLWAELLGGTGAASARIRDLLSLRGVNASLLASQTKEWVAAGGSTLYQALLNGIPAAPVDVINYKADQSFRENSTAEPSSFDDFVGIGAEVDAFAYLLASRSLEPPLAVGLFGDWGSGKSYFLDAIRRRIDQLTQSEAVRTRPQRDTQFWKRIVQVEFNAWHYVEGDLWSSLVDHIFTQLNLASERVTDNVVKRRQRYLLHQLDAVTHQIGALEAQKQEVARDLQAQQEEVKQLESARDEAMAELSTVEGERVAERLATSSKDAVVRALRAVRIDPKGDGLTLGAALDSLTVAQADVARGKTLIGEFATNPRWIATLIAFVIGAPLIAWGLERGADSVIGAAFGGLASVFAMVATAVGIASRWVRARLDQIDKARQEVNTELATAQAAWGEKLAAATQKVKQTGDQLDKLRQAEVELQAQLAEIERELEKRPSELLYEFLRGRLESGDYSKRLGVPAIIRRDFKGLADLIAHQNEYVLAGPEQKERIKREAPGILESEDDPLIINRIVLYIDDLDRCPDGKVIEVLQAVHLLLAFPLFVVVVAVDSRWLAHALQTRYPALGGTRSAGGEAAARPDDYLEKIFQLPFWVAALDDGGRSRIVRGLLGSHVRGEVTTEANGNGGPDEVGADERKVLREMLDPRSGLPMLNATALTVTREELTFLDGLAPLMGDTPRAVKRFVNVYQLLKILRRGRASTTEGAVPDERLSAFLLALAEGLPDLSWRLFDLVESEPESTPLSVLLSKPAFNQCACDVSRLQEWLVRHPEWNSVTTARMAALLNETRRFMFRVIPRGGTDIDVARPQLIHVINDR